MGARLQIWHAFGLSLVTACSSAPTDTGVTTPPAPPPASPPPPPPSTPLLASGTIYAAAKRAAFAGGPVTEDVIAINPNTSAEINLTQNPGMDGSPMISPDGQFILFLSTRNTLHELYPVPEPMVMNKDGGSIKRLSSTCDPFWFSDGYYCDSHALWLANGSLRYLASQDDFVGEHRIETRATPTSAPTSWTFSTATALTHLVARAPNSPLGGIEAFTFHAALYTMSLPSGVETLVAPACTFPSTCVTAPIWSPNGQFIYALRQGAIWQFDIAARSGVGMYGAAELSDLSISPDGTKLAFVEAGSVKIFPTSGASAPVAIYQPNSPNLSGIKVVASGPIAWSPDSKSLAFMADTYGLYPGNLVGINADGTGLRTISAIGITTLSGFSWGR